MTPPRNSGPCRVILLVEGSAAMSLRWPDIRKHFFPLFLDSLPLSGEHDYVSIAVVPVAATKTADFDAIRQRLSKFGSKQAALENLNQLKFEGSVSEAAIWKGFQDGVALLTPGTERPRTLNFVLAALSSFPESGINAGARNALEASLVEHDVRISLLLPPTPDSSPARDFMKHLLGLQRRTMTSPWFSYTAAMHSFFISGYSKRALSSRVTQDSPKKRRRTSTSLLDKPGQLHTMLQWQKTAPGAESSAGGSRSPGVVNDLRRRFGFKPTTAEASLVPDTPPRSSVPALDTKTASLRTHASSSRGGGGQKSSVASPTSSTLPPSAISQDASVPSHLKTRRQSPTEQPASTPSPTDFRVGSQAFVVSPLPPDPSTTLLPQPMLPQANEPSPNPMIHPLDSSFSETGYRSPGPSPSYAQSNVRRWGDSPSHVPHDAHSLARFNLPLASQQPRYHEPAGSPNVIPSQHYSYSQPALAYPMPQQYPSQQSSHTYRDPDYPSHGPLPIQDSPFSQFSTYPQQQSHPTDQIYQQQQSNLTNELYQGHAATPMNSSTYNTSYEGSTLYGWDGKR